MKKRILSMLLTLCLLATLLPTAVLAADVGDFTDVSKNSWYYDYVEYVCEKGLFVGTSDTTFAPASTMTRAMFVTVLARQDGATVDNEATSFDDVPAGIWYAGACAWAAEKGIVKGIGDNLFDPNAPITREQMFVITARYIDYYVEKTGYDFPKTVDGDPEFTDAAEISSWAVKAVNDCYGYRMAIGDTEGAVNPKNNANRAEAAVVLYRLSNRIAEIEKANAYTGGGVWYPPVVTTSRYTITYNMNYDGAEDVLGYTEYSATSPKAFTALDAQERVDYVFVVWNTEADGTGTNYTAGQDYEATGDMTLYAQWIADDDYIGLAMKKTLEDLGYTFSNIASGDTRAQSVDESFSVSEELAVSVIETASEVACEVLGTFDAIPSKEEINEMVDEIVDAVKDEFGTAVPSEIVAEIKDRVYEAVIDECGTLWANFSIDGDYVTGDVTVSVGAAAVTITVDQAAHNTYLAGSKKDAVKKIGVEVAKEMYASLAQNTEFTSVVELSSTVTFTFADGTVYGAATVNYPHVYPVEAKLVLDGGGLVEYKYDGGSIVKLNITEAIQDSYAAEMQTVVEAALDNQIVKNELESRINDAIATFGGAGVMASLNTVMGTLGVSTTIADVMAIWKADNNLDDMVNSPVYQKYWLGDAEAALDNSAIVALVDEITDAAVEMVNGKLAEAKQAAIDAAIDEATAQYQTMVPGGTLPDEAAEEAKNSAIALFNSILKTITPAGVGNLLDGYGYTIDFGTNENIKAYLFGAVADAVRAYTGGSDMQYKAAAEEAMIAEVGAAVEGALEGNAVMNYVEALTQLKTVDTMADIQLSVIANLLTNPTVQGYIDGKGDGIVTKVTNLIDKLPVDANVTVNGVVLNKAALAELQAATTTLQACNALANLIGQPGLGDLTLNSFAGAGVEISASYNGKTFAFTLVIEVA